MFKLPKKILASLLMLCPAFVTNFFSGVSASPGEPTIMTPLPVNSVDVGGTLLFSDSPEYVAEDGILYGDTVTGAARILFYHLNATDAKKRLAIIAENVADGENRIRITRGGISEPGKKFLKVGKETQLTYMGGEMDEVIHLRRGERKLFLHETRGIVLKPGRLVYGVYDFVSTDPVKITVLMCPEDVHPLDFIGGAKVLPKDSQRLRGTFHGMNRILTLKRPYDARRDGVGYILIGDNEKDLYKSGVDATDGSRVVNFGNYGVHYVLNFQTTAPTKFYLSPLGGLYAGAVRSLYRGSFGLIETPAGKISFGDTTYDDETEEVRILRLSGKAVLTPGTELAELGKFSGKVTFEYSPPGASNLPVHIILSPPER